MLVWNLVRESRENEVRESESQRGNQPRIKARGGRARSSVYAGFMSRTRSNVGERTESYVRRERGATLEKRMSQQFFHNIRVRTCVTGNPGAVVHDDRVCWQTFQDSFNDFSRSWEGNDHGRSRIKNPRVEKGVRTLELDLGVRTLELDLGVRTLESIRVSGTSCRRGCKNPR